MSSKRPLVSTRPTRRPSIKRPKARPRVQPKVTKATIPLGTCLLCDEPVLGPAVLRLRHGAIRRRKRGVQFIPLPFDDGAKIKWVCYRCASGTTAMADEGFRFSSKLQKLSLEGWCCLCHRDIEPYPLKQWSSVILLERGFNEPSGKGSFDMFRSKESGHVHFFCMDDIDIELWRLIERTDAPDYDEELSKCE